MEPECHDAIRTAEVGSDGRSTPTVPAREMRVVDAGFNEDFEPVLRIRRYGFDGTAQGEDMATVADPADELGAGRFCTDWHDDVHLLCGRSDGPPIMVSLAARAFEQLAAADGGYPTIVRTG